MKQFDAIRAFSVERRSTPFPPRPKYEWDAKNKRFSYMSAGWHSKPVGYTDPEKQMIVVSVLRFRNGRPAGSFSKPRLYVESEN